MPAQRTNRTKRRAEPVAQQARVGKPTALGCFMKSISDALGDSEDPSTNVVLNVESILSQGRKDANKNHHTLPRSFETSSRSLVHDLDDAGLIRPVVLTTASTSTDQRTSTGITDFTVTSAFIEERKKALGHITSYDGQTESTPTHTYNIACDAMRRIFNRFRSRNRQVQLARTQERKRELIQQIAQKDEQIKQKDERIASLEENLALAATQPSGSSAVALPATPRRPLVGDGSATLRTPDSSPRLQHRQPRHNANNRGPPTPFTPSTGLNQDTDSRMGDTDNDSDDEDNDTRGGGAVGLAFPSAPVAGPSGTSSGHHNPLFGPSSSPADAYATPEHSYFVDTPENDNADDMDVTGELILLPPEPCARCSQRDDEFAELEARHAKVQRQRDRLEMENAASNQLRDELQARYNQLAASNDVLQQDHDQLLNEHHQLQSNFALLLAENDDLGQQLGNLQDENQHLRRHRDELQQGYHQLHHDREQLQQRAAQLQHDLDELRQGHSRLQQEHRQLQQQHGALMLQYGQLQQERDRLQEARDRLEHEMDELRLAHQRLEQQHAQLQSDHAHLQAQNLEQRREQQELQERYFSLHQAYDNSTRELDELRGRYEALEQVNSRLRDNYARLGRDYAQLQGDNARLQADRDEVRLEYDQLQDNYNQLQQNHTRLQQEHTRLAADNATLQESHTQLTEENERRVSDVEYMVNQLSSSMYIPPARRILHHIAGLRERYPLTRPTFARIPGLLRDWFTTAEREEGGMRQHYLTPEAADDSNVEPRPGSSTG